MALKILGYKRTGAALHSVMVQVDSERDLQIYKSFLDGEYKGKTIKCPECGAENSPEYSPMVLRVDNPLGGSFGLAMAAPICHCKSCDGSIGLSMVDYTAFPTVMNFVKLLRAKEQERRRNLSGEKK